MAKNATIWREQQGTGEFDNSSEGDFLLLENGDNILLETGDDILLEDLVYTPKATGDWASETKNATGWYDNGYGEFNLSNLGDIRITESSDTRITESGDTRVLESGDITPKAGTSWSENNG